MEKPAVGEVIDTASLPSEVVERAPGLKERRRPGRVQYSNPALISLLRRSTTIPAEDEATRHTDDVLAPARGVVIGVPIGAAIWCAVGLGLWFLLR